MKSQSILFSLVAAVTLTFGVSSSTVYAQCTADLNGDGQIDQADVAQLLANSGPVPFPHPVIIPPIVPAWATLLEASPDSAVVTDANLRAAIVASGFAWRIKDTSSDIEMLLVPAGTFMMGCSPGDAECQGNESPAHQVTLTNAFYLGKTEVTQAQWTAKMGSNPSSFQGANYPDAASRPVEQVSWNTIASGSNSYMSLTGLRFPTEAEWEFACRAGTTTARYGVPNDIAWYVSNSGGTRAVATKLPNALGLYDTLGNVWEWCADGSGPYSSGSVTNPTGTGTDRLLRGGSWRDGSNDSRGSRRLDGFGLDFAYFSVGFRVARTP